MAKSMPRSWHDRHSANIIEDDRKRALYRSIVADKKPYFMRYIYPALMKQYNTYIKNTDRNALREFQMTVGELMELDELSDRQSDFLKYYEYRMPVGMGDCVMNSICRKIEAKFDGYVGRFDSSKFDYTIMRSGTPYTPRQFSAVKALYTEYNKTLKSYNLYADRDKIDADSYRNTIKVMNDSFKEECIKACPNRFALCDIVLDLCYTRTATKRFAWNMCGMEIIENLLNKNGRTIEWPEVCDGGNIVYCGQKYELKSMTIEDGVEE